MSRLNRPYKFQLKLTRQEWDKFSELAQNEGLTRSELIRFKTIYSTLPRRVTRVAAKTYWELAKEANNLNQIAKALNSMVKWDYTAETPLIEEVKNLLKQNLSIVKQVRQELAELNQITLMPIEDDDDWQTS